MVEPAEVEDIVYDPPLIAGSRYRFARPIQATGFPVKGIEIFPATDLYFLEAIFVGKWDETIFRGRPLFDDRGLTPGDSECFFCVEISSASNATNVSLLE